MLSFKQILTLFALILINAIIITRFLPKPKISFAKKKEMLEAVNKLNSELPRNVGSIGLLDSISLESNILSYHFSVFGDPAIDNFYTDNYTEIGELAKYSILSLNGQHNTGTFIATILEENDIYLQVEIVTPSNKMFKWKYSGAELRDFISNLRIRPTEALYVIIDTQIKLTNLRLPIEISDFGAANFITTNTIKATLSSNERLLNINRDGNNIIFVIETNEREYSINEIKEYVKNPLFIENFANLISEDVDVQEFFNSLVLSHSKLTYRYKNKTSTDSADITISYQTLKKNCNPQLQEIL